MLFTLLCYCLIWPLFRFTLLSTFSQATIRRPTLYSVANDNFTIFHGLAAAARSITLQNIFLLLFFHFFVKFIFEPQKVFFRSASEIHQSVPLSFSTFLLVSE